MGDADRTRSRRALLANELELARANYAKEEDRYKLIADKAKLTFTVASLIATLGFARYESVFPTLHSVDTSVRVGAMALIAVAYLSLIVAVCVSLAILTVHSLPAISQSDKYVEAVHTEDEDGINRALASIYQRTADELDLQNSILADRLRIAMTCLTAGFIAAAVFFGICCGMCWCKASPRTDAQTQSKEEVRPVRTKQSLERRVSEDAATAPHKPKGVEPRIITQNTAAAREIIGRVMQVDNAKDMK